MQNSTLVWIILAALVILGGGWYFFMNNPQAAAPESNIEQEQNENEDNSDAGAQLEGDIEVGVGIGDSSEEGVAPQSAQVNYSASGFSPSTVTVRVGGSVTWVSDGTQMWVAAAQHPTHTSYSDTTLQEHCDDAADTSFDQCKNGNTYTFTFNKAGTWRYHNHSNASHFGTVIVEE